jgi:hypothetical protein
VAAKSSPERRHVLPAALARDFGVKLLVRNLDLDRLQFMQYQKMKNNL